MQQDLRVDTGGAAERLVGIDGDWHRLTTIANTARA